MQNLPRPVPGPDRAHACRFGPGPLPGGAAAGKPDQGRDGWPGLTPIRGIAPRRIDRGDDALADEQGTGVVQVVVVEIERLVADRVDAAAGDDLAQRTSDGRTRVRRGAVDRVESGGDRRLPGLVGGEGRGEGQRVAGGLAAAGEFLGDVPAGLGDRVDEDDAVAGGEQAFDGGDIGLDDAVGAIGVVGGLGADRGEEVAGLALDAALAVVERAGSDPGGPAGGEHDDIEGGGVGVGLDAADEVVAAEVAAGPGAGQAGDRRAGAAGDRVEAEACRARRARNIAPCRASAWLSP